jgi:hypothetical protein
LQTNAQGLTWLGDGTEPLWAVRAKPYIYRVHRVSDSDVFVGTDGNGGRLLAFDPNTGRETMNLKPTRSGVGHLTKLPGHNLLVSTFGVSRSHSVPARLLVLSMHDRQYTLEHECFLLLGTWEHGVVCRTGRRGEHIAVVDVRAPNSEGT